MKGDGSWTTIDLNGESIVRLYDGDNQKYGGGYRVQSIQIDDNWANHDGATDHSSYGQSYDYTIEENGERITSGVAYEPHVGQEESSLSEPVAYKESKLLGSDPTLYSNSHVMAGYYPSQSVGYRQVTVKSIAHSEAVAANADNTNMLAPISVNEFYTPKDFPVKVNVTDLNADPKIILKSCALCLYRESFQIFLSARPEAKAILWC